MLRVEFHCHTRASKDSSIEPKRLLETMSQRGVDRLVVTDHNTLRGASILKALDPERIIMGEEIMTTCGELLAAYVTEKIPPYLSPLEAIQRLRHQGAFISVSHPFDLQRAGWKLDDLRAITPLVDAIEVFNSRSRTSHANQAAAQYAAENHLAGTVGSDAHILCEIGTSTLLLPDFSNADELRCVIGSGKASTHLSPGWVRLGSLSARFGKPL